MTLLSVASFRLSAVIYLITALNAQPPRPLKPHTKFIVQGLPDSAGAKVILINSKGSGPQCHDSQDYDDRSLIWTDVTPKDDPGLRWRSKSMTYEVNIEGKVDQGCWCGDPLAGLAVLAPGRAVAYLAATVRYGRDDSAFINRLCPDLSFFSPGEAKPELLIQMRPKRDVPVTVWARDGDNMLSMARDDIANADWIYEKALAGITLRPIFEKVKREMMPSCTTDGGKSVDRDVCCLQAARSRLFESGAINVYYGNGVQNFSCDAVPAVFIHDVPSLGDAAHELAHQLGLNQTDHTPGQNIVGAEKILYSQGHTTGNPASFDCDNVMWEDTHFFKGSLSLGQAFWMSHMSSSFVNADRATKACGNEASATSHCPFLSLGQTPENSRQCKAVKLEDGRILVAKFLDKGQEPKTCDLPATGYRTGRAIEDALMERYGLLSLHVKGRPDLRLGAVGKGEFKDHWEPYVALNLSHPQAASSLDEKKLQSDLVPGYIRIKWNLRELVPSLVAKIRNGERPEIAGCPAESK